MNAMTEIFVKTLALSLVLAAVVVYGGELTGAATGLQILAVIVGLSGLCWMADGWLHPGHSRARSSSTMPP